MAMATRNEVKLKMDPLTNGAVSNSDEDTVQVLWDNVRSTYKTDMKPLKFANLNRSDSYTWASALKSYVLISN